MTEQTLPDPEQMFASIMERQGEMFTAGRKATLDVLQGCAETASAFADSQDQLAAMTGEVEWLSRLLRAQATFTRAIVDATAQFADEVLED